MQHTEPEHPPTSDPAILEAFLTAHPEVEHIADRIISYSNVSLTNRTMTLARARRVAAGPGYWQLPGPCDRSMDVVGNIFLELMYLDDDRYYPDWTTLKVCAGEPRLATVYSYTLQMHYTDDAERTAYDPRAVLRRMEALLGEAGLGMLMGPEIEWECLERVDSEELYKPVTYAGPWKTAGMRTVYRPIVIDIVNALEKADVPVYNHGLEGCETLEISLEPQTPLKAIDNLVYAHETIREVCRQHKLHATLKPQVFEKRSETSGQHYHFSLTGPTAEEQAPFFLGGILRALPALTGFLQGSLESAPRYNSWEIGFGYAWWGPEHKIAPVRQCSSTHWEIRTPDAMTNPYLQLAAIIAAGVQGVRHKIEPPPAFPRKILLDRTEVRKELEKLGPVVELPQNVHGALDALEKDLKGDDRGISILLGRNMVEKYIEFRRKETEKLEQMDPVKKRIDIVTHI